MSKCELIELKDLSVNDPIELAAPAPRRAPPVHPGQPSHFQVVRLVGDSVSIEASRRHTGDAWDGHDFQPYNHTYLTWCDLCGEFIWGLYKQSLRCNNCSYTCHYRCQPFIQLDCSTNGKLLTEEEETLAESFERDTNVDEQIDWSKHEMTVTEIQHKVKEYNSQTNSNLNMVFNRDGTYTGFVKVHFQLVRPISLPPHESVRCNPGEARQDRWMRRRTSFYLPKDAAKHLHISSQTRVREVIEALLNKFTVVDNPAKFALFEHTERQSQVCMRKLSNDECPLFLRLCSGPSEKVMSLVLKENETGDINWDAFSFPELCNFLRILKREEEEHVRQIVRRYALARDMMKQAMARITTPA
ncbi:ras association domain-containing protein 1 [Takifugu flavidus]|uniref:ras association domain-containing protein 1 n=1 Tax=Takifugu flavidus TaxID=433684 RepID=UPI0025447C45|nr:ras association domain-containing protein 1 [Takifugu flavidus]